jgi:hypothetical protein
MSTYFTSISWIILTYNLNKLLNNFVYLTTNYSEACLQVIILKVEFLYHLFSNWRHLLQ